MKAEGCSPLRGTLHCCLVYILFLILSAFHVRGFLGASRGQRFWIAAPRHSHSDTGILRQHLDSSEALYSVDMDTRSTTHRIFLNSELCVRNVTLTFEQNATVMNVLDLNRGQYLSTENITLRNPEGDSYTFRVHLYPFGAGSRNSRRRGGFGMSYAPVPFPFLQQNNEMTKFQKEKLFLYLQFIPSSVKQTADVSFSMRLRGQQSSARRFDLQWQAGMRFVHPSRTQLDQGQAHDFGTSLMRSDLITSFWEEANPIQVQLDLQIHAPPPSSGTFQRNLLASMRDLRHLDEGNKLNHDTEQVRVGRVVVPVLTKLSQRPRMFELGVYPGVEYRIMRIHGSLARRGRCIDVTTSENTEDLFYSQPGAFYDLKPMYPLVRQLERPWPVTVSEAEIPRLYNPNQYNVISALGSIVTAVAGVALAFLISQGVSLYYIPSRSMEPTLQVGDVLLVEKISPRIAQTSYRAGDVVLFHPPTPLQDLVTRSGGRVDNRDLFVKRIAAEPGDRFRVDALGNVQITTPDGSPRERQDLCAANTEVEPLGLLLQYLPPKGIEVQVPLNQWEVLGDCGAVSIDSRVWGALPTENIVGRPLMRLWPRFGPVPMLPKSIGADEN